MVSLMHGSDNTIAPLFLIFDQIVEHVFDPDLIIELIQKFLIKLGLHFVDFCLEMQVNFLDAFKRFVVEFVLLQIRIVRSFQREVVKQDFEAFPQLNQFFH